MPDANREGRARLLCLALGLSASESVRLVQGVPAGDKVEGVVSAGVPHVDKQRWEVVDMALKGTDGEISEVLSKMKGGAK